MSHDCCAVDPYHPALPAEARVALWPDDFEMPDDFLEWSWQVDDFMKNRQADEPVIHQPALVKNRNFQTLYMHIVTLNHSGME